MLFIINSTWTVFQNPVVFNSGHLITASTGNGEGKGVSKDFLYIYILVRQVLCVICYHCHFQVGHCTARSEKEAGMCKIII